MAKAGEYIIKRTFKDIVCQILYKALCVTGSSSFSSRYKSSEHIFHYFWQQLKNNNNGER